MKLKRNISFGSLKRSDPSCYIDFEGLLVNNDCSTLKEVIETNDIKLLDIPKLQYEIENISSLLGYRIMNLKALLDGNPMELNKEISKNSLKSSYYIQNCVSPNSEKEKNSSELNHLDSHLLIPELHSNNVQNCENGSFIRNGKRKLTDDKPIKKLKLRKTLKNKKLDTELKINYNYEIPNKFWELMEPYCGEINESHLRTLETYMNIYVSDAKYYEVPVYDSDNNRLSFNQSTNGTHMNHLIKKPTLNELTEKAVSNDLSNLLKNIDNEIRKPLSQTKVLNSFPQILVDGMSQETDQLILKHQTNLKDSKNKAPSEASCISSYLAKQLNVSNSYKIESSIRKSVDNLGLSNVNLPFVSHMEPQFNLCVVSEQDGIAKNNEADMIDPITIIENHASHVISTDKNVDNDHTDVDKAFYALRRRQRELKLISASNLSTLKRLLKMSKRDMKRHEITMKLALADADVIESYNVIEGYRVSCRMPLKKDRDVAFKALRERQKILKELEAFDLEFDL